MPEKKADRLKVLEQALTACVAANSRQAEIITHQRKLIENLKRIISEWTTD
jgi:hypothetical protein